MNWISEATSAYASACSSDGGRKIMAQACSQCWDAFDRIAYPTDHGASPEARASVESVAPQPTTHGDSDRTDKAAPRPSEGTGDTPKPISGCVSDRPTPITGPDPDSRVWGTHTPATHATPPQGSEPREGTEPVAWGVEQPNGEFAVLAFNRQRAEDYATASDRVVPLYRHPPCQDFSQKNLTLTDAEAETLRELRDEAAQYADEIGLCASEVRGRQRIIDGLLERLGGGR